MSTEQRKRAPKPPASENPMLDAFAAAVESQKADAELRNSVLELLDKNDNPEKPTDSREPAGFSAEKVQATVFNEVAHREKPIADQAIKAEQSVREMTTAPELLEKVEDQNGNTAALMNAAKEDLLQKTAPLINTLRLMEAQKEAEANKTPEQTKETLVKDDPEALRKAVAETIAKAKAKTEKKTDPIPETIPDAVNEAVTEKDAARVSTQKTKRISEREAQTRDVLANGGYTKENGLDKETDVEFNSNPKENAAIEYENHLRKASIDKDFIARRADKEQTRQNSIDLKEALRKEKETAEHTKVSDRVLERMNQAMKERVPSIKLEATPRAITGVLSEEEKAFYRKLDERVRTQSQKPKEAVEQDGARISTPDEEYELSQVMDEAHKKAQSKKFEKETEARVRNAKRATQILTKNAVGAIENVLGIAPGTTLETIKHFDFVAFGKLAKEKLLETTIESGKLLARGAHEYIGDPLRLKYHNWFIERTALARAEQENILLNMDAMNAYRDTEIAVEKQKIADLRVKGKGYVDPTVFRNSAAKILQLENGKREYENQKAEQQTILKKYENRLREYEDLRRKSCNDIVGRIDKVIEPVESKLDELALDREKVLLEKGKITDERIKLEEVRTALKLQKKTSGEVWDKLLEKIDDCKQAEETADEKLARIENGHTAFGFKGMARHEMVANTYRDYRDKYVREANRKDHELSAVKPEEELPKQDRPEPKKGPKKTVKTGARAKKTKISKEEPKIPLEKDAKKWTKRTREYFETTEPSEKLKKYDVEDLVEFWNKHHSTSEETLITKRELDAVVDAAYEGDLKVGEKLSLERFSMFLGVYQHEVWAKNPRLSKFNGEFEGSLHEFYKDAKNNF